MAEGKVRGVDCLRESLMEASLGTDSQKRIGQNAQNESFPLPHPQENMLLVTAVVVLRDIPNYSISSELICFSVIIILYLYLISEPSSRLPLRHSPFSNIDELLTIHSNIQNAISIVKYRWQSEVNLPSNLFCQHSFFSALTLYSPNSSNFLLFSPNPKLSHRMWLYQCGVLQLECSSMPMPPIPRPAWKISVIECSSHSSTLPFL